MPKGHTVQITAQQDEIIRKCWANNSYGHHAAKRAAELTGLSPDVAHRRAVQLGLIFARERFRWTDPELEVVEQNAHLSLETIQRKLMRGISPPGVKRTRTAIASQIHQQRFRTNLDGMNHGPLADALGISGERLHGYRQKGKIFGERMESIRLACEYTDEIRDENRHWFYSNAEIVKFLFANCNELDLRKVNQIWLMSTLEPYISLLHVQTPKETKATFRERYEKRILVLENLLAEAEAEIGTFKKSKKTRTRTSIPLQPLEPGILSEEQVAALRSGQYKRRRGRPPKAPTGEVQSIPSSQVIGQTLPKNGDKCERMSVEKEQETLLTNTPSFGSVGGHSAN